MNRFTSMLIIYYAIMIGHILFAIVAYLVLATTDNTIYFEQMVYMSAAFTVFICAASIIFYRNNIRKITEQYSSENKILKWQTFMIIKLAMIESACLFNIVLFIVSGNITFLYIYFIAAIIMILNKPIKENMLIDLDIEASALIKKPE